MNGFNFTRFLNLLSAIGIMAFSTVSWATTYVPINTNYQFRVPSWTSVGAYDVYESYANSDSYRKIASTVPYSDFVVRQQATIGVRKYKVQACIWEQMWGGYRCAGDLTEVYSVQVYAAPSTPSLSLPTSAYTQDSYTISWGSASNLIPDIGGTIYIDRKLKNQSDNTYINIATSAVSGSKGPISHPTAGIYTYRIMACNSNTKTDYCSAAVTKDITVTNKNTAPYFNPKPIPNVTTHNINTPLQKAISAIDPEGDPLTYSLTSKPDSSMSINSNSGAITWTPASAGTFSVTARVSDGALYDTGTFTIKVVQPNRAPTVSSSVNKSSIILGQAVSISATAADLDNNLSSFTLCYNTVNSTGNCSTIQSCGTTNAASGINCSTSWTPSSAGTYYIFAKVTDTESVSKTSSTSSLIVRPPNSPPSVSITSPAAGTNYNEGADITFNASAADSDGRIGSVNFYVSGTLVATLNGNCSSAIGSVQHFSYTWQGTTPNNYNISADATDCEGLSSGSSTSVPITVNAISAPTAPSINRFIANSQTITSSSTGNYTIEVNSVSGGSRYQLYENGSSIGELSPANLTKTVSNGSGTYQYCARAARVVNNITRWSGIGTGTKCKSIIVNRPKPVAPRFSPITLQQTGDFTLQWPDNSNTTYYRVHGKTGGIDGGNWVLLKSNITGLNYTVSASQPGLYSYQLTACNAEGCEAGQQLTINTLSPFVQQARIGDCGSQCLSISGIGFDANATVELLSQAENVYLPSSGKVVNSNQSIEVTVGEDVIAAAADLGVRITVKNPNNSKNSLLFSSLPAGSRPRLTDASLALSNYGVIYATSGNQLLAVDMVTGEYVNGWPQTLDGVSTATPAINSSNGDVYVGTLNKQLYAFNSSGQQKWKTQLRGAISAGAVLDETPLIYQGSLDAALYAINLDGNIEWQYPVSAGIAERPVLFGNGLIYVTSKDAATHVIDRNDLGPYALRWPFVEGSIVCDLPICLEMAINGWQPGQDEVRNDQLLVVGRLFYALLGRSPGERELTFWAYALVNGASVQEIVDAFLLSPEGINRFPPTMPDSAFLNALYAKMFYNNIPDTFNGVSSNELLAMLESGSTRAEVVLLLTNSFEYGGLVDNTLHQVFFYLYDFCILANDCVFEGDSDGDGISDADEVANGLDPLNPFDGLLDTPYITASDVNELGEFFLSWELISGASEYQIEEAIGDGGFATLNERSDSDSYALQREAGVYHYRVRSCLVAANNYLHCANNYSNTVNVAVGGDITFSIDYPLAETPHSELKPLEVAISTEQDASVSRVSFELNDSEVVISADTQSPYRYQFGKQQPGEYTLKVIVEDVLGHKTNKSLEFTISGDEGNPEPVPVINLASPIPIDAISDLVGLTAGQFRVDESGSTTYAIPLSLPQGIAGVQPELALSYHSNAGNGTMGIGWQVSGLSGISRCRQTLEQDGNNAPLTLSNEDRFCLDGQKLIALNGTYGANNTEYRTEIESKVRVYSYGAIHPEYFKVQREDGSTSWYGAQGYDGLEREDAVMRINEVPLNWLLNSTTDNMGTEIEYLYQHNPVDNVSENEVVISEVVYGGNRVTFNYSPGARTNITRQYVFGTSMRSAALLNNIVVTSHIDNTAVRSYVMDYEVQTTAEFDRVAAIYECDGSIVASASNCMPPTQFKWNDRHQIGSFGPSETLDLADDKIIATSLPIDIDSNGFTDMVYITKDGSTHKLYIAYNEAGTLGTPQGFNTYTLDEDEDARLIPVDLDGNGILELIYNRGTGSNINWGYVRFDDTTEVCAYTATAPANVNNGYPGFCDWSTVNYSVNNLGFTYAETGDNLVVVDINTDAYPDLIYYHNNEMKVAINDYDDSTNTIGFATAKTITVEEHRKDGMPEQDSTFVHSLPKHLPAYDFNGDGVADFMLQIGYKSWDEYTEQPNLEYYYWVAYVFSESNGSYSLTALSEVPNASTSTAIDIEDKIYISDINGDGLGDVLYRSGDSTSRWRLTYSTGTGFTQPIPVDINNEDSPAKPEDIINIQYIDVTYDGRADIVFLQDHGKQGVWHYLEQTDDGFLPAQNLLGNFSYLKNRHSIFLADWDADGILGLTKLDHVDQSLTYRKDAIANPHAVNRISTITNGFGIKTKITYGLMTNPDVYSAPLENAADLKYGRCQLLSNNDCAPIFDVIAPSFLVSNVSTDTQGYTNDGVSLLQGENAKVSVDYHYQNLRIQARGRGSLGFEHISTYDPQKDVTTTTQYHQDWPYTGIPRQTVSYLGSRQNQDLSYNDASGISTVGIAENQRLSYAKNSVAMLSFGIRPFPYISQIDESSYRINSNNLTLTEPTSTSETVNSWIKSVGTYPLLESIETATTDADNQNVKTTLTTNQYTDENPSNWWINRVTQTDVRHSETNKDPLTRSSEFSYRSDNGLLDFTIVEPEGACDQYLKTQYGYDTYGNRNSVEQKSKDGCPTAQKLSRIQAQTYDDNRYIATQSNTYFTEQTVVERNALGQPTEIKDANNMWSKSQYGRFGQPFYSYNQTGDWQKVTRRWANNDGSAPAIIEPYYYVEHATSATKPEQWSYFDKLGRQVASVVSDINGTRIYRYTRYDNMGNTVAASLPRQGNSMSIYDDFARTTYDKFARPIKSVSADGTETNIEYLDNGTISTIDFNRNGATISQTQQEFNNAFGQTVKVIDNIGNEVSYQYDVLGNLETVTNSADDSVIVTKHDKLSRKFEMTDPSKGKWTYTYNALGDLLTQTDAKQNVTIKSYDNVGRLTTQTLSGGRSVSSTFINHQLDNVIESDSQGSTRKDIEYDVFGRVTKVITLLNDQEFTERTTYDQHGRVFQQFDGSGGSRGLRYHYRNGYVHRLQEAREGVDGLYYQSNNTMDAYGNVEHISQGNGVQIYKSYNNKNGFVESILATKSGVLLQDAEYQFDGIGNLLQRQRNTLKEDSAAQVNGNSHQIQTQIFDYDELNRLTHVNGQHQVAYQANGNIDWKFDALNGQKGYYCYDSSSPHAVTGLRSSASCGGVSDYEYDLNGNMTQGRNGNVIYAAFDKPIKMHSDNGYTDFAYDASRNRYKRVDVIEGVTTTTYYVGNIEVVSKSDSEVITYRRNIPGAIALYRDNGTHEVNYMLTDQLGSLDTLTNEDGEILQKLYFDAWGKKTVLDTSTMLDTLNVVAMPLNISQVLDITPRGFTGHEHIDHADIIHMNGRIYDPTLGRFLQADPIIQSPYNSQSYNRYSYVFNNPLSYTDPSGFSAWTKFRDKWLKPIVAIAITIYTGGLALGASSFWAGAGIAAAGGAASGFVVTGSLKGALVGAFSAAAFYGVGSYFQGLKEANTAISGLETLENGLTATQFAGKIAAHALAGGVMSDLQGGKFGHGFFAAGVTQAVGLKIDGLENAQLQIVVAAVVGGTVSKLTGGKFANGAVTAAFARTFNDFLHDVDDVSNKVEEVREEIKLIKSLNLDEDIDRIRMAYIAAKHDLVNQTEWENIQVDASYAKSIRSSIAIQLALKGNMYAIEGVRNVTKNVISTYPQEIASGAACAAGMGIFCIVNMYYTGNSVAGDSLKGEVKKND